MIIIKYLQRYFLNLFFYKWNDQISDFSMLDHLIILFKDKFC